jgi:hypothetical protein
VVCRVGVRLKAASFLAIGVFLVLLALPTVDLPETNFDEANTPTNEMVVQEQSASAGLRRILLLKVFVPRIFTHNPSFRPPELSYSSCSPVLFSTLRC